MRISLTVAFLAASAVSAGPAAIFSLALEKPFGYAWYDLEHSVDDPSGPGTGTAKVRSRLDFPLDPFRVDAAWAVERGESGSGGPLRFEAEAWISLGPAFFKMRDQDWAGMSADGSPGVLMKFSDTRSRAETLLFGGQAETELGTLWLFGVPFAIGLGAGAWRYDYGIFGYSGKVIAPDGSGWVHVSGPDDERVATYETWSAYPILGVRPQKPILGLEWKLRLHPLTYAGSLDDHIYRKKQIEMECMGTGGALEVSRGWRAGFAPYARFELERTWGKMRQAYYADSPDTPENETGMSVSGIETTVNAWLVAAGIRWGWGRH